MKISSLIVLVILNINILAGCSNHVKVEGGLVSGTVENGLTVYKGIPFAEPPVGGLRWTAPRPAIPWAGVLQADSFAKACFQSSDAIPLVYLPAIEVSEDCLYLNIWTPAKSRNERLPVMVWIYGGGFFAGASFYDLYHGEELADMGVVYVSVAYRVGKFGFLAHPALSAESPHGVSGNYGLLDQIAALKWVKENISEFGGDPDNITIFGESAGGYSVSMLAASPLASGLFHKVISQSGASFEPPGESDQVTWLVDAEQAGIEFADSLGVETLGELRNLTADQIFQASRSGWPVADGYVIPDDQYRLYEAGKYNDVPVLIGTNSDEGRLFSLFPVEPQEYETNIRGRFADYAASILKLYPGDTPRQAMKSTGDIKRDTSFAWPTWTWARLQSRTGSSDVYLYYFDQIPPSVEGTPPLTGADHGAEMPFMFKHLEQRDNPWREEDYRLSGIMAAFWVNFARTGDPNGDGLPQWPPFEEGKPAVMYLNSEPGPGPVPGLERLRVLEDYFAWRRSQTETGN